MDTTEEINRGELLLKVGILLFVKLFCTVCVLVQIYKKIRFVKISACRELYGSEVMFRNKKKITERDPEDRKKTGEDRHSDLRCKVSYAIRLHVLVNTDTKTMFRIRNGRDKHRP
jgi:hypothetical protein